MSDPLKNPTRGGRGSGNQASAFRDSIASRIRVGQIITLGMIMGLLVMGVIMACFTLGSEPPNPAADQVAASGGGYLIPAVGFFLGVTSWIIAAVLPTIIRRNGVGQYQRSGDKIELPIEGGTPIGNMTLLVGTFITSTLVGQAILEGGAIANLVLMMVDQQPLIHVPLAMVSVVGLLLLLPTVDKMLDFIESAAR